MIYKNKELLSLPGVKGEQIEGVKIKLIKKIPDERGTILHMLRSDEEIFNGFGEILLLNHISKCYKRMAYP